MHVAKPLLQTSVVTRPSMTSTLSLLFSNRSSQIGQWTFSVRGCEQELGGQFDCEPSGGKIFVLDIIDPCVSIEEYPDMACSCLDDITASMIE